VLDLGVDLFALLAHVRATRPPADHFPSQREAFPLAAVVLRSPRADRSRRAVCDRAERNHRMVDVLHSFQRVRPLEAGIFKATTTLLRAAPEDQPTRKEMARRSGAVLMFLSEVPRP
jgi:hypothetical protein